MIDDPDPKDIVDDIEELDDQPGAEPDDADFDNQEQLDGDDLGDVDSAEAGGTETPVARQPSRAQARVEAALAGRRDAEAATSELRREMAALRAGQQSDQTAERERLALADMDPYDRLVFQTNKAAQATEARFAALTHQLADSADRTDFAAKAARNSAYAAVAEEVETSLAGMRAAGTTAPRETVAAYLIGKRAIDRAAGAKTKAVKAGAARVTAQTTRPGSGRSDVRAETPRNDTVSARNKRLENLQI